MSRPDIPQTNFSPENLPREAVTPIKSKRILATTGSGRKPKIDGISWENKRFKTTVNDRRASLNACFSVDQKEEFKKKAASWLTSINLARRSCDDIIKALEGTITFCFMNLTVILDMKKAIENYENEFFYKKPLETVKTGDQGELAKNLETMFAELTDLLES